MTPFELPLTIRKGISYQPLVTFIFQQADASPFSLEGGWKVIAYARLTKYSREKIDLNPIITDAPAGTAVVSFTKEQTTAMTGGEYGWDLILEDPDGIRTGPYFAGPFKIKEINTHA